MTPRWHFVFLCPIDDVYPSPLDDLDSEDVAGRAMNETLLQHERNKTRTFERRTKTIEYDVFLTRLRSESVAAWCNALLALDDEEKREAFLVKTTGTVPWGIPLEPDDDVDPAEPFTSDAAALAWLENAVSTERYVEHPAGEVLVVGETREYDHEWALFTADALKQATEGGGRVLGSVLSPLVHVGGDGAVRLTATRVRLSQDLPNDFVA